MNSKPSWSDCHVEWQDAKVIKSITHIPSGVILEVNSEIDEDRDHLLDTLAALLPNPAPFILSAAGHGLAPSKDTNR